MWAFLPLSSGAERYHYDHPGRLIRVVYDDLSSIAYSYDANGNLTAVDVTASGIPGDADGDSDVDQDDVDLIVQVALAGGEPYTPTADCNLDDAVSVLDVVCALGAGAPGIGGSPGISGAPVGAMRGDTVGVALSISGVGGIARAFQLDLAYDPAVLSLGPVSAGAAFADHLLLTATPSAGTLRLVAYSPTNAALASGPLALISFDVDAAAPYGPSALPLSAVEVARADATALLPVTVDAGSVQVFQLEADVSVAKTADRPLVADGDSLTYTVTVANGGPSAVSGVEVEDLMPGALVSVTWTCAATGGATCSASGAGDVTESVDLPAGDSVVFTVSGTVDTGALELDNTATVAAPAEALDAVSANDVATASVKVCNGAATLTVDNVEVAGSQLFVASSELTVGPAFTVPGGAEAVLRSCGRVVLGSGVVVQSGGELTVETGSP